jgi:small-conductance mechanosensitive channel
MTSKFINDNFNVLLMIVGGTILYHIIFYFIKKQAKSSTKRILPELLSKHIYFPGQFFMLVVTLYLSLVVREDQFIAKYFLIMRHALQILLAASIALLLIKIVTVFRDVTIHHYTIDGPLDYSLRKAKTKFQLIQRVFNFLVIFAALAAVLMTFDSIRQIGTTLLASAGVLGLVIGFAAQKSLGTLFAGLQIAIAQPIRIDDTVVVEDQFGTIGEITLTYVVINSWDGRRLVVPINYFLENPFENWTRTSPEVVGKIKFYADYSLPVDEVRKEFNKWLLNEPLWDKRTSNFIVSNSLENTIELRATMSARNSDDAFTLECQIREKLIQYVQTYFPQCLPKTRFDIQPKNL